MVSYLLAIISSISAIYIIFLIVSFIHVGDPEGMRLRYWPLDNVLLEKYDFAEQDAHALAEFLLPLLDVKCSL